MTERKFDPQKVEALMFELQQSGRLEDINARYISAQLGGDYNKIAKAVSEFKDKAGLKLRNRPSKPEQTFTKLKEQFYAEFAAGYNQQLRGMQLEIDELGDLNTNLSAEIERLKDENSVIPKLHIEISDYLNQIQTLTSKNQEITDQIQLAEQKIEVLQNKNIDLDHQLIEQRSRASFSEGESAVLKNQIEQLQLAIVALEKKYRQSAERAQSISDQQPNHVFDQDLLQGGASGEGPNTA